jgi:hypothetical protein
MKVLFALLILWGTAASFAQTTSYSEEEDSVFLIHH